MAGYSLGGNLTLKLAGELGADGFPALKAVAAVSPVIELEACMRAIERRQNRIYEWNFCRNLQGRMRRKARTLPELFDISGLWKVWSIRQFDDRYTAPHHGFDGASDYYHRASAMRVIDRVARPALIISAADDPFVPPEIFSAPAVARQPAHHDHGDVARRPLRIRRRSERLRRLLGRTHRDRVPGEPRRRLYLQRAAGLMTLRNSFQETGWPCTGAIVATSSFIRCT